MWIFFSYLRLFSKHEQPWAQPLNCLKRTWCCCKSFKCWDECSCECFCRRPFSLCRTRWEGKVVMQKGMGKKVTKNEKKVTRKWPKTRKRLLAYPLLRHVDFEERKGHPHIKVRKSSGHRPGVRGTPGWTNKGLPAGVPGTSCCSHRTTDSKRAFLPGHQQRKQPGVPGTPGRPGGFQKFSIWAGEEEQKWYQGAFQCSFSDHCQRPSSGGHRNCPQ